MTDYSIEPLGVLEGHGDAVTSLVCGTNEDGSILLISGSRDKSIIQWQFDLEGKVVTYKDDEGKEHEKTLMGKPYKSFHGHNHFVSSLALNSDCTKLISGSWDKTIRLWDVASASTDKIFKGHTKDVLTVGFSDDERLIFSGGMDNSLKYWNTIGDLKHDNHLFRGWVSCILNFTKDKKKYIAVGSWDGTVHILNSDYNPERTIAGGEYAVTSLSADLEGEFLFIAYKDGTVKVYNFQTENKEENDDKNFKYVIETGVDINCILFETKFFEMFAIGTSKGLQIRRIKVDKKNKPIVFSDPKKGKAQACLSLTYDKSKNYLFAGFADGTIKVYKIGAKEDS